VLSPLSLSEQTGSASSHGQSRLHFGSKYALLQYSGGKTSWSGSTYEHPATSVSEPFSSLDALWSTAGKKVPPKRLSWGR